MSEFTYPGYTFEVSEDNLKGRMTGSIRRYIHAMPDGVLAKKPTGPFCVSQYIVGHLGIGRDQVDYFSNSAISRRQQEAWRELVELLDKNTGKVAAE